MRAVKHTSAGIEVVEIDPPEDGGVRVHIRAVGICGTDLSLLKLGALPFVLGHEMAGVLDDGRPVAVEPIVSCETCDQCLSGNYHRCRVGPSTGLGIGRDGGMTEIVRVPERCLTLLPAGARVEDASLVEPLAVVLHGLRLAELQPAQRVLVIGAGSIGLLAVAAAVTLGCEVALSARHPHQAALGEKLGATAATGRYDLVIECAGTEAALAQASKLTRHGGTILLLAVYWDKIILPGMLTTNKELRIVTSACYNKHAGGRDFESAAALLARRPELAELLVTHRFPLSRARDAFETAANRKAGVIKVVMHPD